MGVTIYYSGTLKTPESVHNLITEVSDIARSNNWKYQIIGDSWEDEVTFEMDLQNEEEPRFSGNSGLKGIVVQAHPELSGLSLLFDRDGACRTLTEMARDMHERNTGAQISTQDAGINAHIRIIGLLQYVADKYLEDWELEDDSGFAVHGNRNQAVKVFEAVDDAIQAVTEAFDTIEMPEDITGRETEFLDLVEARIRTYLPGAEIHRIDEEE